MNTRGRSPIASSTDAESLGDGPQPSQLRADAIKQQAVGEEVVVDPDPVAPPVNKDIPYVSGTASIGSTLNCTMGNWTGEPTTYAYKWSSGGTTTGTDAADYTVVSGDAGKDITCVVTATNQHGSTTASPSNAVSIPAAA